MVVGVTTIGAVSRAATGVKMQSNGQGTFWGSVKRSSGVLGLISSIARRPILTPVAALDTASMGVTPLECLG